MGRLTPLRPAKPACKCGVAKYVATLDTEDTKMLTAWLEDETITAADISTHLRNQAPPVTLHADSIRRWRRLDCNCRG